MTDYKWKRCQECGAKARIRIDSVKREPDQVMATCPLCAAHHWYGVDYWDAHQAATRARKRFELTCASISSGLDPDSAEERAEFHLNKMYGEVPEGDRLNKENKE